MGSYQSSTRIIIPNQAFNLSITMFSEYFIYTNYILNLNSIDYTDYNIVLNTNGTNTIIFTNLIINEVGTYQFTLRGDVDLNPPTIMIQGLLVVIYPYNPEGTKILCEIYKKYKCIDIKKIKPWIMDNTDLYGNKKLMYKSNKFTNSSDSKTKKNCKLSQKKLLIKSEEKKSSIKYDFLNLENYQYLKNQNLNDELLNEYLNYQKNKFWF